MTEQQYAFLINKFEGDNSSREQVFNECRSYGWCAGLDFQGRPVITKRGAAWIKSYQPMEEV